MLPHHLLFGDTLMLTALLAKLRDRYPDAEIVMTVDRPFAPLYAGRPYGVRAHAFDARDLSTFSGCCCAVRASILSSCRPTIGGRGSRARSARDGSQVLQGTDLRTRTGLSITLSLTRIGR